MASHENDRMLIVVGINQARNFQKRPGWELIIEAKLDGETISTDPIPHDENPNFNTELAWEVDKKGFRMFRVQRIPIKLQCFAFEPLLKAKESLGFLVIDLRLVHPKPQVPKWYTLLNPKYYWMKPEINLCVILEKDTGGLQLSSTPSLPSVGSSPKTPKKTKTDKEEVIVDTKILQPVLSDEEGYYQIGPDTAKDIFSLSVTIVFAGNLNQLLPSGVHVTSNENGYYFYYALLSNDVTTDTFPDLMDPSFAAERATVRIRSSIEFLRQFFSLQPGIKVHLCSGDISLGCAHVPLNNLLVKNSTEIFMKPVSVEGMFELESLDKISKESSEELAPFVGLSVTLRMEDQQPKVLVQQPSVINSTEVTEEISPPSTPPPQKHKKDLSQSPPEKLQNSSKRISQPTVTAESNKMYSKNNEGDIRLVAGGTTTTIKNDRTDFGLHHYCFTLDMRHIKFTVADNMFYCFLRYSYPFFGTSTAIVTHPLMEVRRNVELSIPNGFCAFTFASTPDDTSIAFNSLPLRVEVVRRDRTRNEETIIGMLSFNLAELLKAEKSRITNADNKNGLRQVISVKTPIHSLSEKVNFIGHVQTIIGLDDFGVTTLPPEIAKREYKDNIPPNEVTNELEEQFPAELLKNTKSASVEDDIGSVNMPNHIMLELRDRQRQMAVEIAMELEEWKKEQEDQFRKNLKAKENYYMESLVNEWRKRDTEREVTIQRKIKECQDLERKLRNALTDAENREKLLTAKEIELEQRKNEFERVHERQQSEVKSGYLRLRDEFVHRLQIENEKLLEAESQHEKSKQQIMDLEMKLLKESRELEKIREQRVANKPELKLESELQLAALEKAELERKLEAATKSKVHYKQQWGRCLRELARIKQKLETDARAQLYRQQQELEGMKRQYLATENNDEKKALQEIKGQLDQIKEHVIKRAPSEGIENRKPGARQISFLDSEEFDSDTEDTTFTSDDLSRLLKERETLLETGIYTDADRIIRELDRQIDEAEMRKQSRY